MSVAVAQHSAPVRRRRPQALVSVGRDKSHLRVVRPAPRSTFSTASAVIFGIAAVLAFVVIFQTVIAEQQLRLDKVSTDVRLARQHYDELRQQRAELRAPDNLRTQAMLLGMSQGLGAKFEEIPADVVASVMVSTGAMDPIIAGPQPMDSLAPSAAGVNP